MIRKPRSAAALLMHQRAWLACIPLAVALIAGGFAYQQAQRLLMFDLHGAEAEAVINDKRMIRRDSGAETRRNYNVSYRYTTSGGDEITGMAAVASWYYNDVSPGDRVSLRYLPDAPDDVLLDRTDESRAVLLFAIPALIALLVTLFVAVRSWRRTAAMLRAGRERAQRRATVLDHLGSRTRSGDQPMSWRLRWRDEAGHEGESLHRDGAELNRLAPRGSGIAIHVDPRSRRAFWEEDLFAR